SRRGHVAVSPAFPLLRVFRYERGGNVYFMVFNEDMRPFRGTLTLPVKPDAAQAAKIDLLYMKYSELPAGADRVELELSPYESCVLAFGADVLDALGSEGSLLTREKAVPGEAETRAGAGSRTLRIDLFDISRCASVDYPEFTQIASKSPLFDITGPGQDQRFCCYIRYEAEFEALPGEAVYEIELSRVGDTATVWLNGIELGSAICPPYRVRPAIDTAAAAALRPGVNKLTVEVANSLAYTQRDKFSVELMVSASGLLGPVEIILTNIN
ncbi:MAG: hypothetical protein J6V14_09350, partial [Clostridia bacterium]|nr:hypothetical protein [Clostridia bacterium]